MLERESFSCPVLYLLLHVHIFNEQAQYSPLGPSFLQPLYNFYLTSYSLSGQGTKPSYCRKESLFFCPSEIISLLHPLIFCTSFTRFKEVGPLLDIYPLEGITVEAIRLFQIQAQNTCSGEHIIKGHYL